MDFVQLGKFKKMEPVEIFRTPQFYAKSMLGVLEKTAYNVVLSKTYK